MKVEEEILLTVEAIRQVEEEEYLRLKAEEEAKFMKKQGWRLMRKNVHG